MADNSMEFVKMLQGHYASYHNHKETMAHAGLLVQIALFAGVLSMNPWPPAWAYSIKDSISPQWITFIIYSFLWLIIGLFTCWQLKKRNDAQEFIKMQIEYLEKELVPENKQKKVGDLYSSKGSTWLHVFLIIMANLIMLAIVVANIFLSVRPHREFGF
jgi:hypothetical protein